MKDNVEELIRIDMSVHIHICFAYFDKLVANFAPTANPVASSSGPIGLKHSIHSIYKEAKTVLLTMLNKKETDMLIENLQPDGHWMGNFLSNEMENSRSGANFLTVSSMIHDLVILTSFLCTSSLDAAKSKPLNKGKDSNQNKGGALLDNWILFLAPYWAIVAILTQSSSTVSTSEESIRTLKLSLQNILKSPKTINSSTDPVDEVLTRIAQASSTSNGNVQVKRILSRIRRAVKSHLRTVLLFAVFFSLALHSDSVNVALRYTQLQLSSRIQDCDTLSISLVDLIAECVPRLTFITDSIGTEASPLSYCAAFRDAQVLKPATSSPRSALFSLPLELCKVLTKHGPSVVALADRMGMCPLHYAARKGETVCLEYLVTNFPYAASFKDSTGKLPIHHALLNWRTHTTEAISLLAEKVPLVLVASSTSHHTVESSPAIPVAVTSSSSSRHGKANAPFKPLQYAEKNCSSSIFTNLTSIAELFAASNLYAIIRSTQQQHEQQQPHHVPQKHHAMERINVQSSMSDSSLLSSTDGEEGDSSSLELSSHVEDDEEEDDELHEESVSISSSEGRSCTSSSQQSSSDHEQMLLLHFANSLLMLQSSPVEEANVSKKSNSRNNKRKSSTTSSIPPSKRSKVCVQ